MTNSYAPVFDPEGKYLYFLSDRDFNEVLGNVDFEFANPKTTRIYVVTLRKDEASPFQPLSDETQIKKEENKDELLTDAGPRQDRKARPRPKARRRTKTRNDLQKRTTRATKTRAKKTRKTRKRSRKNSALTSTASGPHCGLAHRAGRHQHLFGSQGFHLLLHHAHSGLVRTASGRECRQSTSTI